MNGYYYRYLVVFVRFLPFALAFLRDRRRFLLFGSRRRPGPEVHRRRARQMRDAMLELGPAFIKVGQVLSTRPDLVSRTYAEVFGTLQNEVPEESGEDPRTVVETELGTELDTSTLEPIAGGSLAHVYTVDYEGEQIALKVRRPGIQPIIERDLRVIRGLVPVLSLFVDERKQYSIENVADDFEEVILAELDFDRERTMMTEIRGNFGNDERVSIPAVYEELSSERLLAMEYVTGRKITDPDAFEDVPVGPHEMATRLVKVYLEMGLVDGVFHADPHPGNLAITESGQLVLYDFGMSERLPPAVQADIVALYRALVHRDVDELVDALIVLDVLDTTVDRAEVGHVLELVIENLEGRSDITWRAILTELTTMLRNFPFRIPPDVMLLIRVGTVSEGVCRQLDPEFDFLAVIHSFLVEQDLAESQFETLIEEGRQELRTALPALVRLPTRADRVLGQLERGELVVQTETTRAVPGERNLGYAVLAGALFVAASVLTLHDGPYELLALTGALLLAAVYLVRNR